MARSFEWARHEIFFSFKKGVSCDLIANKVTDFVWYQSFILFLFYFQGKGTFTTMPMKDFFLLFFLMVLNFQ